MPPLPTEPGVYLWLLEGVVVYVGQTRMPLRSRLGSNGYAVIASANTLARETGRTNGGQQTNCRVNALANAAMVDGGTLEIWYRVTGAHEAAQVEQEWMRRFGVPVWNRRDERRVRPPLAGVSVLSDPVTPQAHPRTSAPQSTSRYALLEKYLAASFPRSLALTFTELERIVDLPASALKYSAWWANSRTAHCHAAAWLDAGYNAKPDFNSGAVRFERGVGGHAVCT